MQERAEVFNCAVDRLIGILHPGAPDARAGVVIVVGGPQYRVGSHRQFVAMARHFAAAGVPVLRFDYRGMGDAEGGPRAFDTVDDDIRAAIDCFTVAFPDVRKIVLLGLCDAASANLIYAHTDSRVNGLILLNPWVRTSQGEAKSYLRHYYLQRILQKSFWHKVLAGDFTLSKSLRDFLAAIRDAHAKEHGKEGEAASSGESFLRRMRRGLEQFRGRTLLLISGRDLTAMEFVDLCRNDHRWKKAVEDRRVTTKEYPLADHTMSISEHLDQAGKVSVDWLVHELSI